MKTAESETRSLNLLCGLLGRTRQAYYQHFREAERTSLGADLVVREVLKIREDQKRIGGRKLYYLLGDFIREHRLGIGRDAFFDLLREQDLLIRFRSRKKPRTTFSVFHLEKYPNLAKDFIPTAPNQLWVSDITYIRIGDGFAYLSLVTDAYSRKIVGWHLRGDLTARGPVRALKMALKNNPDRENLIHHSDRGMQYYSRDYMKLLKGIRVSMSENSDPIENSIAERVNGILKQELLERRFASFSQALEAIGKAVNTYNNLRPHLSIDMLTPAEAHTRTGELKRRWKNYYAAKPDAAVAFSVNRIQD